MDWAGMDDANFFPTLRSFTDSDGDDADDGEGIILCGQDDIVCLLYRPQGLVGDESKDDCIDGYDHMPMVNVLVVW